MRKKRVCKKRESMEQEQQEGAKWVTHYCSDHQILLVGEGDFSFSLSLAHSFGSASNIVASSLDSYDDVKKKYKQAKSNLDELQKLGACLLHGVDATKMEFHSDLKVRLFDRVIFNFPHAGFYGKEDNLEMIKMHKDIVLGFFKNASQMLTANGEIHVNHKITTPYNRWDLEELAMQSFLTLIERADFKKEDYPGYNNKRGSGDKCDEPFLLGECSTFKFTRNPRAMLNNPKRRKLEGSRQQTSLAQFQGIQDNDVPQLPPATSSLGKCSTYKFTHNPRAMENNAKRRNIEGSRQQNSFVIFQGIQHMRQLLPATSSVGLNCYHEPKHHGVSKFNAVVAPLYGLPNGRSQATILNHLNNDAHRRDAPCDGYSSHGTTMIPGSQRLLQPLQPMEPTSTNVRYAKTDRVRTMDNVHLPLCARNDGYQVYNGSSNYLQEAHGGGTSHSARYSYDRIERPEFESLISEMHWRALNGANHVHSEHPQMSIMMEDRRRMFVGFR